MTERGAFLPCMANRPCEVEARHPDPSAFITRAALQSREQISGDIFRLKLETETTIDWRAGQVVSLRNTDGDIRSYSVLSRPDDCFIEILVRLYEGGKLSDWLVNQIGEGDELNFTGPSGTCYYRVSDPEIPLLLIGTGVGAGAIYGIARDAVRNGHQAPIRVVLGSRTAADQLLVDEFAALGAESNDLEVTRVNSREGDGYVTDAAFDGAEDLSSHMLYLCGSPDMVEGARIAALCQNIRLDRIHADPFEPPAPYEPKDPEKIASLALEPEIWDALDQGKMLTRMLTEFYNTAFEDVRLSPFFQKATKQRLIEKQFSFLRDLFTGKSDYFGERPFNAHHWMIISDELFDYREELFFGIVSKYDFPQELVPRWRAVHELFRREIVKSTMRGQWFEGKEVPLEGYTVEIAEINLLCDRCESEIEQGATIRFYQRTGEVYCADCSGD